MGYKIINIGLDPVESYPAEVTNSIDYLSSFGTEQVSVEKDVNIYWYEEGVKFVSFPIIEI
jgi:hypothetical protein